MGMIWSNDNGYVEYVSTGLFKVYDNYGNFIAQCVFLNSAICILKDRYERI